jgi:hypothetical protein
MGAFPRISDNYTLALSVYYQGAVVRRYVRHENLYAAARCQIQQSLPTRSMRFAKPQSPRNEVSPDENRGPNHLPELRQ